MSKGVLGNDPFKRGAADRSADTEPKEEARPEKPALPDPRTEEVKQRVKDLKPGAPFLESPDKEPQKTRIATKQKSAKQPDPKSAVAAEKKRAAASEPEATAPTARRLDDELAAEKRRARASDDEPTQATQRRLDAEEIDAVRRRVLAGDDDEVARPNEKRRALASDDEPTKASARTLETSEVEAEKRRAQSRAIEDTDPSAPKIDVASLKSRAEALNPEETQAEARKFEDSEGPKSFDLKTGERRPIREAIRTMTVDSQPASSTPTREQVFDASARGEPSSLQKVATETVARAVVAAAGLVRALKAGLGASGAVDLDPYGKDPQLGDALGPVADFLYERYWRVTVNGADRIPTGPCILVANHSGALPYDGPVLHAALSRERRDLAGSRWLVEDQVFYAPVLGTFLNRLGAVRANPENALRLLAEGRPVIVFPEGIHGLQKPFAERYQLKRFGRGGFVKIALQTGAPIVPVAIVGAEETSPLLARIPTTLFGMPYLPLSPLGPLPLPAKWHIRIGAPFTAEDLKATGEEEAVRVQRGTELTREAIQGMLEAVLRDRNSAFR